MKQSHLIIIPLAAFFFAAFALQARAEVQVGTGSFVRPNQTGLQTVNGIGFQPKAIIFFYGSTTVTTAHAAAGSFGMGFIASTTQAQNKGAQGAVTSWSDQHATDSNTGGGHNAGDAIIMTGQTGTTYGQAQLKTFDANGFTLNWSAVNAFGAGLANGLPVINYIAIGGDEITNASSSAFTMSTGTGDQAITGMGFTPDFVMFITTPLTRAEASYTTAHASFGFGFGALADTGIKQGATAVCDEDAQATADTGRHQSTTAAIIGLAIGSGTNCSAVNSVASLASMNADGFTINKSDAPAAAHIVYYLAIKGGIWNAGNFTKNTSAGTQARTDVGFRPSGVFFSSFGKATGDETAGDLHVAIGAVGTTTATLAGVKAANGSTASATTSPVGLLVISDNTDSNPDPDTMSTTTMVMMMSTTNNSTFGSLASYQSHNNDGFTINWNKSDATASEILWWAVGGIASTTQRAYAFFNDDGSSASSTIRRDTATSTAITGVRQGERLVARIQVDSADPGFATTTQAYRLQWENNTDAAGTWNDLGSTTQISWSLSQYAAPRTRERRMPTPAIRVTSSCTNSVPYIAGEFIAGSGTSTAISLRNQCTELAYAIETSNALGGKTYRLRLIDGVNNNDFTARNGAYSVYPTFTTASFGFASTTYWKGAYGATSTVAVDGAWGTAVNPSLAIGIDGNPLIALSENSGSYDIHLARCLNTACTATTSTIISLRGGAIPGVLALGIDGNPLIALPENSGNNDIDLARCLNTSCTATTSIAVDGAWGTALKPSLALGIDGNPLIASYSSDGNADIYLARCLNTACTATTSTAVDGAWGTAVSPSLALGIDGNPLIASYSSDGNADIYLARCLNTACTATTSTAVDGAWGTALKPSLALGIDGNPLIASYSSDGNKDIYLAVCHSLDCTTSYPSRATSTAQATTSPYWFFDQAGYDNASTSNNVYDSLSGLNARLVYQFSNASTTNTDPIGIVWEGNVSGGGYGTTTTLEIYNFAGGYWETLATGTVLNESDYTLQATTTGTASNYYNGGNRVVTRIVTATTSATTTQYLKTDFINISFGGMGAASLKQHHYRWREDNGNEVGASWAATEDNALSSGVFPGDRRRLRFSVSNANAAASNITYRLEYASGASCDSGWTPVPSAATTEHWVMDPSYYLSEEAITTAALSVPPGKSFVAGYAKQASNQTSAHNLTASQYSEFEYAIKSTANAATGTNYCFRLTNAGVALNNYSVTPQITLSSAARPQTGGGGGEGVGGGGQQSGGSGQSGGAGGEGGGSGGQTGGGSGQGGGGESQEFVPWLMPWLGYMYNLFLL